MALALGGLVVLELAALPLTGSRGGLLALGGGLALFALAVLLRREGPDRRALRRLLTILALGVPLAALLSGPIAGRLVASGRAPSASSAAPAGGVEQANSNQFRRLTWKSTARMALANPLLGTGVGKFKFAHPRYAIAGFTEMAHQSYLQVAAETGVFGLVGLLLALLGAALAVLRAPRSSGAERWLAAGLGGGIAAAAAHNMIDYSWFVYGTATLFWGMMGLVAGLARSSPAAPLPTGEGGDGPTPLAPPPHGGRGSRCPERISLPRPPRGGAGYPRAKRVGGGGKVRRHRRSHSPPRRQPPAGDGRGAEGGGRRGACRPGRSGGPGRV